MADSKMAATIGTEYARMLHHILPRIEDALSRGKSTASFTVACRFRVAKNGEVQATLAQTASIPLDNTSFKLSLRSGQLSLFEGSPVE